MRWWGYLHVYGDYGHACQAHQQPARFSEYHMVFKWDLNGIQMLNGIQLVLEFTSGIGKWY